MKYQNLLAVAAAYLLIGSAAGHAGAATYDIALIGNPSGFTESSFDFNGQHFDQFSLGLDGLSSTDSVTVSQGDVIDSTVFFIGDYTIPMSMARTDILQFLTGSSFPSEDTGVSGEFNFYDGATLVRTFDYGSSSSGALSSFAAVFPPDNTAFTFDSFTNDFMITNLATPATLDGSSFTYDLVSDIPAAPEPSVWALLMVGGGLIGFALRFGRRSKPDFAR